MTRLRVIRFSARRVTIRYSQVEKLRIRLESGQLLPRGDERFLGDVLRVLMVAEQPQRHPVGQQPVTVDEIGVRVNVAFLGPPDQVGIVNV